MPDRLLAVDGTNWSHVLFHGMGGKNIIPAFTRRLNRLKDKVLATTVLVAWDRGQSFRHDLDELYKANRDEKPQMLDVYITQLMSQLGQRSDVSSLWVEGFEADDILATAAHLGAAQDYRVFIASADKDLRQCLVDDRVALIRRCTIGEGQICCEWFTESDLHGEYGLAPSQWVDYQCCIGDASDNVRGIDGIGPKTAQRLLRQAGSLDGVYRLMDGGLQLTNRQREGLKAAEERLPVLRQLVTLRTDVGVVGEAL